MLFDEGGFDSVQDLSSAEALHVDSVLANRRGYCLSLSVVALAMADLLGEPLQGVAAPNHFFVRWDAGQEGVAFDVELTRRGELADPAAWREQLADFLHDESLYLRPLDTGDVLAILQHNRGFVRLSEGRLDAAQRDFEAALAALPLLPELHRSLGVLKGERKQWEAAITHFERALELHPGDVDALLNSALCRHQLGERAAALRDLELVLLLDPSRDRARELIAEWNATGAGSAGGMRALSAPPPGLRAGLKGEYFSGTRFDQMVLTRVDPSLDFDWKRDRPAPRVPRDRFSVRWTGWFKAERSGLYTLFAIANDGLRIRFGEHLALDHWEAGGSSSWTGSGDVQLAAGWHPLTVEYFDQNDNARLLLIVGVEGEEYPLKLEDALFYSAESEPGRGSTQTGPNTR